MEIDDRVYGKVTIDEPVLIELINSKPVQRLKHINQYGVTVYAYPNLDVSRFEHSIGVMILLKKLGAPIEEQIAGVLHDVPHTAFSHVIDYVFGNSTVQDFHEKFHEKLIMNSEIPNILEKHGFNVDRILDEHNFPLLERSAPDMCADRMDYALRDFINAYANAEDKKEIAKKIISHYIVHNNELIFNDQEVAKQAAEIYLHMNATRWAKPQEVVFYQLVADAIKIAMEENIITEEDLFQTDDFLFQKLKNSKNQKIQRNLSLLKPEFTFTDDPDNYEFFARTKFRYIDPKFKQGESIKRVTDISEDFKKSLEEHKKQVERGHFVRLNF